MSTDSSVRLHEDGSACCCSHNAASERPDQAETAIDPVCGMTVVKETAKFVASHDGQQYYFCAEGCRTRFAKSEGAGGCCGGGHDQGHQHHG
jgi:Cu+-exporting ATPase